MSKRPSLTHLERRTDNIPDRLELFFKSPRARGKSFPLAFIAEIINCRVESLRPAFSVLRRRNYDVSLTHDWREKRRYYSVAKNPNWQKRYRY